MYIIDKDYFNKEYYIPNINEYNSSLLIELNSYIETEVRNFLLELLGVDDFNDMNSFIVGGAINPVLPTKWNEFFNGKEYTNSTGKKVRWNGLVYKQGDFKQSLLVPYVSFKIFYDKQSQFTNVGEKVVNSINSNSANPYKRAVYCWNSFLEMYQGNFLYMDNHFPCFENNIVNNVRISLLEFLNDHKTSFTSVNFKYYQSENQLGI